MSPALPGAVVIALVAAMAAADQSIDSRRPVIGGIVPEWRALTTADFAAVNGEPTTWTWVGDELRTTGQPIGVLCTRRVFHNLEFVIEWRHLQAGGNSGVFVWVPEGALAGLAKGVLPDQGIEIQMLDHAYTQQYESRTGKKADWFTTNGDVFGVGKTKFTPFAPTSPNGLRSFPRKALSRGVGEWNHYYVRAINGEVRLWVNGEEVSGGSGADPSAGTLCVEAEGAPVEFRSFRVREVR